MDDDIDIEEHDLLDNPAIKNIFPDLSILKKEISGYFEEASRIKKEPAEQSALTDTNSHAASIEVTQQSEKALTTLLGNKIILGSKPSEPNKIALNDNGQQDLYATKVYLNDIRSYLDKSERFCKICLTIFPQKGNLEIHEKTAHMKSTMSSTMEAKNKITIGSIVKTYKCNECHEQFSQHSLLRRHLINIHKKNYRKNNTGLQPSSPLRLRMVRSTKLNQCFHCKISFSSKKLLIEHIYMVLQSKKSHGNNESKITKTEKEHKNDLKKTTLELARVMTRGRRNMDSNCRIKSNNSSITFSRRKLTEHKRPKGTELVQNTVEKLQDNIPIYQCFYCSYIFSHMKFCLKHIINKHKDSSVTAVKAVKFDEQCKYCYKRNCNWKLHNIHMQMYHKEKIDKTIRVYPKICLPKVDHIMPKALKLVDGKFNNAINKQSEVDYSELVDREYNENKECHSDNSDQLILKSILFRCKRCDIHFLSAKTAMNHADHMELLINWKCLSCYKIFKKNDENSHMKQHLFCNNFTVFELTEAQLACILYKCSKCTIHFDSNGYLPHFKKCEKAVSESVYCKFCDILVDKRIAVSHKSQHSKKNIKPTDFTILNSDAIGAESIEKSVVKSIEKSVVKSIEKSVVKSIEKSVVKSVDKSVVKPADKKTHDNFKLMYCKICNSFITQKGRCNVHKEARCAHLPTYICQLCGLKFTNKTMGTHRMMHKLKKGIRLQNFSFYNDKGRQILPPIPDYPKCEICHVHFMSKLARVNHVCSEDFLTCHICNIKLSEPVFKLHMSFHYYSRTNKDLSQTDTICQSIRSETLEGKRPPRPPPRKREETSAFDSISESTEIREPEIKRAMSNQLSEQSPIDEVNCRNADPIKDGTELVPHVLSDECQLSSMPKNMNTVLTFKANETLKKTDFYLFNVLYCCINCRTTIDTYDAVVEHCQDHLCGVEIGNIVCETCKLKLDLKSYENHKEFHALEATNKSFELLEFDTFYFALDNSTWITHLFQNFDNEISQQILNRSIYRYGGKMKMQVIQEGLSDLTVYKCNSCFVIVDPDSLLKHVENSCFKTRKHPCSNCGLPFMSYLSLKKHMDIHKKMNISIKSYTIVIINQEKDKKSNKLMNRLNKYFLLYKCRNCNGVIDSYQRLSHKLCNDKDLKRCSVCNLLIYTADYKAHMRKHQLVAMFVPKNMKIILFGQGPLKDTYEDPINQTNFDGTIVDFIFIQCVKCGVCLEKSPKSYFNHSTCFEDSAVTKCVKCELKILKSKFARHTKLHDINVHFVRENMNIIPYDHCEQLSKFIPADSNRLNGQDSNKTQIQNSRDDNHEDGNNKNNLNQINFTSPCVVEPNVKIEKKAKLFKCSCGLHFLDTTSLNEHLYNCSSEKSKQHCSKCNLLFTPSALFTHLLMHHGDKNNVYTFEIKEMSKKQNRIVTLYNCVNCKTHFLDYNTAIIHFENCKDLEADRKECSKCKLFFSTCSIAHHETFDHDEKVADVEIVDVVATNVSEVNQSETDARSIDVVIEKADFVRESKYNISDENLSQIDLSRYSNTIFKCATCNTHFLTHHTFDRHLASGKHILSPQDTCSFCELSFSLQSLAKHIYIHHKQMKLNNIDFIIKSNL